MRRSCRKPAAALRARYGIRCFVAPSPARDGVDNGVILPRLRRGQARLGSVPRGVEAGLALTPTLSVSGREVRGGGGAGEGRAFGEGSGAATLTPAFSEDFGAPATLAAGPVPFPAPPPGVGFSADPNRPRGLAP